MKKILTCLLAILGLTTACAQVNYETDVFKTKSGKEVTFHALTHASIRIQYDGKEIEVDPVTKLGNKTIDYAFLPCNQPYTMTPDQLIKAAKIIKPKVVFPYHYGQTDLSDIPEKLQGDGIDVRIRHYE